MADVIEPRAPLSHLLAVAAIAALVTASHLVLRTGFVLDDWYVLGKGRFDGVWHAGGIQAGPRPGQWLVYTATFGIFGRHPVPYVLWMGLFLGAAAIALLVLARKFLAPCTALAVVLVWLLLPNHMTAEVWASTVMINVALLFLFSGFNVGLRPVRSASMTAASAVLLGAAVLTYEAVAPVAVAGVVLLPLLAGRSLDRKWILTGGAVLGAAGLWVASHWSPHKSGSWGTGAIALVTPANFGWGVVGIQALATVSVLVVIAVSLIAIARVIVGDGRGKEDTAAWCIIVGWAVVLLSLIPFLSYIYEPVGLGDRANCVSSIGGALVLVGVFKVLWSLRREVAVAVATVFLVGVGVTRHDRTLVWATAFGDADRILAATQAQIPNPDGTIVFGPVPIVDSNITAFIDVANVRGAVRVQYDDPHVDGDMAHSLEEFCAVDEHLRVDLRPLSRLGKGAEDGDCTT